jgi:hypothetical protein
MPGFDRTGPMGMGPMTGGGRGRCNAATRGYDAPFGGGYGGRLRGARGFARGFGMGQGRRKGFGPYWMAPEYAPSAANEPDYLKTEAEYLRNQLNIITKRLEELEGKSAGD